MSYGFNSGFGGSGVAAVPTFAVSNVGQLTSLSSAVVGSIARIPSSGVSYILDAQPPSNSVNWVVLPSGGGSRSTIYTVANISNLTGLTGALQGDLATVSSTSKTYSLQSDPYSVLSNWVEILSPAGTTQGTIVSTFLNSSGATIPAFRPVQLNSSNGSIAPVDVSVLSASADSFGITQISIANNSSGPVVMKGRLLNLANTWTFGSTIWVSKAGTLTDVAPDVGVGGFVADDVVIKVGYIAGNTANPAQYDLIIEMEIVGTL